MALHEEREHDGREDLDHGGGRDQVPVHLAGADEGRHHDREGPSLARGEEEGQQELVPAEDEHEGRHRHDAADAERQGDADEEVEPRAAVDAGGFEHFPRHPAQEGHRHPDREGDVEARIGDDQGQHVVKQPERPEDHEQRHRGRDGRHHAGAQDPVGKRVAAAHLEVDEPEGGRHRQDHGEGRRAERDHDRVQEEGQVVPQQGREIVEVGEVRPHRRDGDEAGRRLEGPERHPGDGRRGEGHEAERRGQEGRVLRPELSHGPPPGAAAPRRSSPRR